MDISIIEYIGEIDNGIGILMSWVINNEYYEFLFWFNTNMDYKIIGDDNLNKFLNVNNMHEWKLIENLIVYINTILPSKNEIFKKFNIEF